MFIKLMAAVAVLVGIAFTGCVKDEVPSVEKISAVAKAVGYTAGYACELSKTKTEVKEAISAVLDSAALVVPAVDQTFTDAWGKIVTKEIEQLVASGKLTQEQSEVVKVCANAATAGLDYVFNRYPKAKAVQDRVSAAVANFVAGYKSVVTLAAAPEAPATLDEDALAFIKKSITK